MATKYTIEMDVPDDMDPSELLERAQELAVELAEEYPEQDDDGDEIELTEDAKEAIRCDVSVQEVGGFQQRMAEGLAAKRIARGR